MTNPRNGSYAIIPCFILDDETLDEGAKTLYARISMYSEDGRCWATNKHFADKQKVTTRCIQLWLEQLKNGGYIEVEVETGGFQTKRNIWIINDFKKQFTKRNTVHPSPQPNSPPPDPQFASSYKTNINKQIQEQQQAASPVAASFDKEKDQKLKELKKLPLSAGIIESSLMHSLIDIKNATEHCLNRIESIKDIDAYFHEALSKKWLPKPNKARIEKLSEEVRKKEQQQQQKLYIEAAQLITTIKFKEGYSVNVNENAIRFGTPKGFHPEALTEKSITALRQFIKLYKK